jgi:hypothetical protein
VAISVFAERDASPGGPHQALIQSGRRVTGTAAVPAAARVPPSAANNEWYENVATYSPNCY